MGDAKLQSGGIAMIRLAEPMFKSLQGEGKHIGRPSIFVRLFGCNFRCEWANGGRCDTPNGLVLAEGEPTAVLDLSELRKLGTEAFASDLVITGGEPFLRRITIDEIVRAWDSFAATNLTIETNCWFPHRLPFLSHTHGLLSISPKVNTTEKHNLEDYAARINRMLELNEDWDHQIKFVADELADFELFDELFNRMFPEPRKIYVMACGTTPSEIDERAPWIAQECLKREWNYSDRLHVRLWGGGQGR